MVTKTLPVLAITLLSACGTGAIVTTRDARHEGTITGHDSGRIYVDGRPVDRSEVADIDHPGNVAAIIGSSVAALGLVTALGNCTKEERSIDPTPCTSSGLWMLTGIPIAIYGIVTHSNSVSAAGE